MNIALSLKNGKFPSYVAELKISLVDLVLCLICISDVRTMNIWLHMVM